MKKIMIVLLMNIWCNLIFAVRKEDNAYLAQHYEIFNEYTSKQHLTIIFANGISTAEKEQCINSFPFLKPFHTSFEVAENHYVAVLKTNAANYKDIQNYIQKLQQHPDIELANPVLLNIKKQPVLVLDKIFFATKGTTLNEDFESLIMQTKANITPASFSSNIVQIKNHKHSNYNTLELSVLINKNSGIAFAEPNYGFFINSCATVNDQFFNRQWALKNDGTTLQGSGTAGADMNVTAAWDITMGNGNIKIAILDSGIDTLHLDLQDNLLPGFDATGRGSKGYPNSRFDSDAHGTACAGIAAAIANNSGLGIAGVCPNCKVVPVKIFYYVDSIISNQIMPYSESAWMAAGINWAWQNAGADILSNSWGLDEILFPLLPGGPTVVDSAIQNCYSLGRNGKGASLFFSSGNDGGTPIWPSRLSLTFAVNATSMCDERKNPQSCDGEDWWEGNWKQTLDFGAPGVKIMTTDMRSTLGFSAGNYTASFNGTSAACPNAAGVAALLLSIREDLGVEDIRYLLGATADRVGGYDYSTLKPAGMWSEELGYGRINAFAALQSAQSYNVSVQEKSNIAINLYPNPAEQTIYLDFSNELTQFNVAVTNTLGAVVLQSNSRLIDISHLEKGIYFLRIDFADSNYTVKKFIKN